MSGGSFLMPFKHTLKITDKEGAFLSDAFTASRAFLHFLPVSLQCTQSNLGFGVV